MYEANRAVLAAPPASSAKTAALFRQIFENEGSWQFLLKNVVILKVMMIIGRIITVSLELLILLVASLSASYVFMSFI